MKSYKITEEQIKEVHSQVSIDLKNKIEKWCPEVFETKLEVGKWYRHKLFEDIVICPERINRKGILYGFGFNKNGNWVSDDNYLGGSCLCNEAAAKYLIPATEEEAKEALIKEAKKRGFKEGVKYKSLNGDIGIAQFNPESTAKTFFWEHDDDSRFNMSLRYNEGVIFNSSTGKWAEIIEEEIKVVENEEPSPRYTVTFETLGAVTVTLEGNNLDNLMVIAKDNNLR